MFIQTSERLTRQLVIAQDRASRLLHIAWMVERIAVREKELRAEETSEKYLVESISN